jgi:hypothetical protein
VDFAVLVSQHTRKERLLETPRPYGFDAPRAFPQIERLSRVRVQDPDELPSGQTARDGEARSERFVTSTATSNAFVNASTRRKSAAKVNAQRSKEGQQFGETVRRLRKQAA